MLINKERREKTILTIHGPVTFSRTVLTAKDKASEIELKKLINRTTVCPVDDLLGITNLPFKATQQAMSFIAKEATKAHSYDEASKIISKQIGYKVSTKTVERITDFVGKLSFDQQCKEAEEAKKNTFDKPIDKRRIRKSQDDVLYCMTDGAMLHVRDKEHIDLSNDKIDNADNSIKHICAWTESKHAICFHVKDIKYYYADSNGNKKSCRFKDLLKMPDIKINCHKIENRDCIGYIGSADVFKYHLLALAERNNWKYCNKVVLISDGAKWIEKAKEVIFKGREIIQILDLYHAKENTWKFVNYIKKDKKQKEVYGEYLCKLIDEGKISELLKELEKYKDKTLPAGVPNLYGYIKRNKNYMNYPEYKKQGLFVGSGAMESANIYMMQDRMKLSGMKWNVKNGRHMLSLKSHLSSRTWNVVEDEIRDYCTNNNT